MERAQGWDFQGRAIEEKANRRGSSGQISGYSEQGLLTYEQLLARDPRWALSEGSRHFEGKSAVFDALRKITDRLNGMGVPYAVVGGMALFQHGLRRFTEDVDILVTKEDLRRIHNELEGLGYLPPYARSKHLRDTELGVRIEFLTTGEYRGDGKEKPVAFPNPASVSFNSDGVNYLNLPTLVELKLASGMTNAGRMKDLSDVLELIKNLNLPAEFADQLNPYMRCKYLELWNQGKKRYQTLWRNKWLTSEAKTIEEMIASLRAAADHLEEMRRAGVILEDDGGIGDDYATLVTTDPEVAKKFGMEEEREYLDEEDDEDETPDTAI
ncbi:MAG: hypothetical protein ACLQGP_03915 [Isosphaeraceae bacterium]